MPRSSSLWQPLRATTVGLLAGPLAMYLWAVAYTRRFIVPDPHDSLHMTYAVISALVGATFAFLYAKSVRKSGGARLGAWLLAPVSESHAQVGWPVALIRRPPSRLPAAPRVRGMRGDEPVIP